MGFKKYYHSFIQSAVFTGRVARQNNGLYVLRMIVKLAYWGTLAILFQQSSESFCICSIKVMVTKEFGVRFRAWVFIQNPMFYKA